jgi:coenzyme F420-dependent glucose-6-phosphate dehydrogenase
MAKIGYALSSEEHAPRDLVRNAARAEEVGFEFSLISDHYHPWLDRQGNSPFVWAVIGGIAGATTKLRLGTGVTCPIIRIHPAIIAQAAATAAEMMPGRFFLGVGTGENLNEHVLGDRWPPAPIRIEMLEEAIQLIRLLWRGDLQSHYGSYFVVENARIYTLPAEPPQVYVAASGSQAMRMAGRVGDGLISLAPDEGLLSEFGESGGRDKPRYGMATVCWAETEEKARETAYRCWPNTALKGPLSRELALPSFFEAAVSHLSEEDVAQKLVCSPDPERHVARIREYIGAGYDHVYVHQVGPDQEGFFHFYEREVLPHFNGA